MDDIYQVWTADNTCGGAPKDAPVFVRDGLSQLQRMQREFQLLQERGW